MRLIPPQIRGIWSINMSRGRVERMTEPVLKWFSFSPANFKLNSDVRCGVKLASFTCFLTYIITQLPQDNLCGLIFLAWTCSWIEVYQDLQIFAAHLHFHLSADLISSGLVKKINWMASEQLNCTVIKGGVITRLIQSRPSHLNLIPLESAEPGMSSPATLLLHQQ